MSGWLTPPGYRFGAPSGLSTKVHIWYKAHPVRGMHPAICGFRPMYGPPRTVREVSAGEVCSHCRRKLAAEQAGRAPTGPAR